MKDFLNRLNGWQRLFTLVSLIWLAFAVITFKSPMLFIDPDSLGLEMKKELSKKPAPPWVAYQTPYVAYVHLYGGEPVPDEDLPESERKHPERQGLKQYRMDTGALVTAWDGYTLEEVKSAYEKGNGEIERKKQIEFVKAISKQIALFFLPITVLYFFGWMLGWIYRGFKSKN